MSLLANDPLTQLAFSVHENKGVFALLLGSGLSHAAEIPTGWEITLDLIRRVALAQGAEDQPDWAKWCRDTFGQEPNYSVLLNDLASSPEERRAILHSYIEPTEQDREEGRKVPTVAHQAVADLVRSGCVKVIVTTNFDRLMESALRERGVEPTVVASIDALLGAQPLAHSRCYILKLHGDYKDARILNTDSELSAYPAEYNDLLDRIFDEYGLIVCGWSGEWDHALRAAFLRAPNRRYPIFWAARGKLGDGAQELVDHRRARIVPITDADGFFTGLRQQVETLEHSRQQNPLSVELLVNSTKRFLAKPEYRIQLEELFAEETNRLVRQLDVLEFSAQANWSPEEFHTRVGRYEAATESLARMAGVLARWGDGSELPLVLEIIRTLHSHAEKVRGGTVIWLNLRSYPAVLIFTSCALGLTRAQRWVALHDLFTSQVAAQYKEPTRVVDQLFLWAWNGSDKDYWKHIEGYERRKTPFSDHRFELFSEWGKSFVGLSPDLELLYERFELLASLAHLEEAEESSIELSLAGPSPQRNWTWMPVGRIGWDKSNRERLTNELQSDSTKAALLAAGFAKGSPKFLELFIANLSRIASQIDRW